MNKNLSIKIPCDLAEILVQVIDLLVSSNYDSDADKLLMATLGEFRHRLWVRLGTYRKVYGLRLKPTEAIALRLMFVLFVTDYTTQLGAWLHDISNRTHKLLQ